LASLLLVATELSPDVDNQKVVEAIISAKVCPLLTVQQISICERALLNMKANSSMEAFVFLMEAPSADRKLVTTEKVIKAERLRVLMETISELRRADAAREAMLAAKKRAEEQKRQAADDDIPPAEPPAPREHHLTPRVFWHMETPPAFRKPRKLPQNPQKVQVTHITPKTAVLKWEKPAASCKLLYTIRVSENNGKSFKTVQERWPQKVFQLTGLEPEKLYYVTISSRPAEDDAEEFPPHKLAKRPQKLLHFWTASGRVPPDRFCNTPEPFTRSLPPLRMRPVAAMIEPPRPHSLPDLTRP
jgi:hypothetical protein